MGRTINSLFKSVYKIKNITNTGHHLVDKILFILLIIVVPGIKAQNLNQVENLIAAQRFEDAKDTLQQIKKMDPKNPYVYFSLGEAVIQSFKTDSFSDSKNNVVKEARGYFEEGIRVDSLNPLNYVGLGIVELFNDGNTEEADKYFNKALSFIPEKKKKIKDIHVRTLTKLATAELYSPNPRIDKAKGYISRLKEIAPKSSEVYIAEGDILLYNTFNASEAISSYERALLYSNNPLTHVRIGRVYISARMYDDAKKHFEAAIKADPMFAPAYKGLGDLYYRMGQNNLAKENYARFLQLAGNNIPAKTSYAKALFWAKDYEEALKTIGEITKVDTTKPALYRIGAYSAFSKEPPEIESARFYMDKLFTSADSVQLIPQDYLYYGRILLVQHKDSLEVARGIQMMENAYKADTSNTDLIGEIVKNAYYYKVYPVAAKYLTLLINHGMDTPNNYLFLGKVYYQINDYANADSAFARVIAKDSANVEAYLWRAYVASAQDPDMKQGMAGPFFEELVSVAASNPQQYKKELTTAYNYLGSYYLENGNNLKRAGDYFEKLLAINPDDQEIQLRSYNSLAYINVKQSNWQKAKDYYQRILRINPKDPTAVKGLNYVNKNINAKR